MKKKLVTLGIPKNKVLYLPNSINAHLFVPKKQKQDNMLLFVGRISAGKGLHILVKSLQYLKENIRLVVIGPCGWDKNYYQGMLELIERENRKRGHKIIYLGAKEPLELIEWYQKASLFILPSFNEGFPVTILEALACKTPVIATPVGGIPEIIKNHETGILVPQHDPKTLAKAIQYLLENKDIRLKMGHEGRKRVIKQYSLEIAVKKLSILYKQLKET
jgi:glycosyltransferase involved in cell wall biosynthesis